MNYTSKKNQLWYRWRLFCKRMARYALMARLNDPNATHERGTTSIPARPPLVMSRTRPARVQ